MFLTLLKLISFTFFRNKLKSIEHNNLFAIRRRNAKIIIKNFKNYLKDVIIKEFFEFFN